MALLASGPARRSPCTTPAQRGQGSPRACPRLARRRPDLVSAQWNHGLEFCKLDRAPLGPPLDLQVRFRTLKGW